MSNQSTPSAVHSATFVGADCALLPLKSLTVILDVTAAPGVDTVQLIVEGKDPQSGKYYTVLSAVPRSAVGTDVLTIAPGIAAVANVSANAVVPPYYRARVVHSAASNFTYSLSTLES